MDAWMTGVPSRICFLWFYAWSLPIVHLFKFVFLFHLCRGNTLRLGNYLWRTSWTDAFPLLSQFRRYHNMMFHLQCGISLISCLMLQTTHRCHFFQSYLVPMDRNMLVLWRIHRYHWTAFQKDSLCSYPHSVYDHCFPTSRQCQHFCSLDFHCLSTVALGDCRGLPLYACLPILVFVTYKWVRLCKYNIPPSRYGIR